ncbi:hypothetical protein [Pontibacter burrus]|uniref:Uncharacterized protein n=1 Tax=Pontibacter burrus TaxID=2704466 RepID=A0A6B3M1S5_9BACT|nr:hypothetical protein [Pontibacter burrus]NEM99531.1 hypothetical protein [Pontibacter burrus]
MNAKDKYLLETWPKQQAKGKMMYMVYHALIYGLLVGVISLLFRNDDGPVLDLILSKDYLVKFALFTTIGVIMANYKWRANNKRYEALKQQNDQIN